MFGEKTKEAPATDKRRDLAEIQHLMEIQLGLFGEYADKLKVATGQGERQALIDDIRKLLDDIETMGKECEELMAEAREEAEAKNANLDNLGVSAENAALAADRARKDLKR